MTLLSFPQSDDLYVHLEILVRERCSGVNMQRLFDAYTFAKKAHFGQYRKSGEEYINHPIYAAMNMTRIAGDETSLISCLLHDVPEDTPVTIEKIREVFGEEVAHVVDGVTKLSKVHYKNDMKSLQIDSLRKMFLSLAQDVRVILVKLCDRMHNISTLEFVAPEKSARIARETMEIYYPITVLLSLGEFMSEMVNTCFRFIYPQEFIRIEQFLRDSKNLHDEIISGTVTFLSHALEDAGITGYSIESRLKDYTSLYKKIHEKKTNFESLQDIFTFRLIVRDRFECYQALAVLHSLFQIQPEHFRDYISSPKGNGYQSIHTTVFDRKGNLLEFHIETQKMKRANDSGFLSHLQYTDWIGTHATLPTWMQDVLKIQDHTEVNDIFFDQIKEEVLASHIACYSPKGKLIELTQGACVLDFAAKIHSDLVQFFSGARINGKETGNPFLLLQDKDVVEIIITKEPYIYDVSSIAQVKTTLARSILKAQFRNTSSSDQKELGKHILNMQLELFGLPHIDMFPKHVIQDLLAWSKKPHMGEVFLVVGNGVFDKNKIVRFLLAYHSTKKPSIPVKVRIHLKAHHEPLLADMLSCLQNFGLEPDEIIRKTSYIFLFFRVEKVHTLHLILSGLEHLPGVDSIERLFPRRTVVFYLLLFFTLSLVVITPLPLGYFLSGSSTSSFVYDGIFASTFIGIILSFLGFSYLAKNILPSLVAQRGYMWSLFIGNWLLLASIFLTLYIFSFSTHFFIFIIEAYVISGFLYTGAWFFQKKSL